MEKYDDYDYFDAGGAAAYCLDAAESEGGRLFGAAATGRFSKRPPDLNIQLISTAEPEKSREGLTSPISVQTLSPLAGNCAAINMLVCDPGQQ